VAELVVISVDRGLMEQPVQLLLFLQLTHLVAVKVMQVRVVLVAELHQLVQAVLVTLVDILQ
jgi:hypothetical protein